MATGGLAALRQVVRHHIDLQHSYEQTPQYEAIIFYLIAIGLITAGVINFSEYWYLILIGLGCLLVPGLIRVYNDNLIRKLYEGLDELKGYIRNVLFDYEIWRELMEDDNVDDIKLGPIELAHVQVSFAQRIERLFLNYPKLAAKKSLEPFPAWYRPYYTGSNDRRENDAFKEHYWQYALALVLDEEFPERPSEPDPQSAPMPEVVDEVGI